MNPLRSRSPLLKPTSCGWTVVSAWSGESEVATIVPDSPIRIASIGSGGKDAFRHQFFTMPSRRRGKGAAESILRALAPRDRARPPPRAARAAARRARGAASDLREPIEDGVGDRVGLVELGEMTGAGDDA